MDKKDCQKLAVVLNKAIDILKPHVVEVDSKELQACKKLAAVLNKALELLADVRYQYWPTIGLGVGLKEEVMDEILAEGDLALRDAEQIRAFRFTTDEKVV